MLSVHVFGHSQTNEFPAVDDQRTEMALKSAGGDLHIVFAQVDSKVIDGFFDAGSFGDVSPFWKGSCWLDNGNR
jgi:hypothetical protein